MNKKIQLCIVFILLISINKNSIAYALYVYNNELFTSLFCENKAKPALQCHGKCEMKKMQGENNSNSKIKQLFIELLYNQRYSSFFEFEKIKISRKTKKIIYYTYLYHFEYKKNLNKPPIQIINC